MGEKSKYNKRKEKHDQKFPNETADISTGGRKPENDKSDTTGERKKEKHKKSGKDGDKPRSKDNDKSSHHRHHRKRHTNGASNGQKPMPFMNIPGFPMFGLGMNPLSANQGGINAQPNNGFNP